MLRPVWPADPQKGPFPEVLQTIRRLLIRSGCFRLERELPGGICTHDICAPWQGTQWNRIEHRLFCLHHPELARQAADQPPGHRRADRHHHDQDRAEGPLRDRHARLIRKASRSASRRWPTSTSTATHSTPSGTTRSRPDRLDAVIVGRRLSEGLHRDGERHRARVCRLGVNRLVGAVAGSG